MEIILVGGKRGSQSSALDWDVRDLPERVVLDGERFVRHVSRIYIFDGEEPK